METGEAGFFFFVGEKELGGRKEKGKKKERKKNENGNVLAGQAGMEVTGWRRIVGLVRKDIRREVLAGWRRKESSGGRKVWCSVKNLTGKVFAGCGRKTVADWRKMSGVAVLPAGAG